GRDKMMQRVKDLEGVRGKSSKLRARRGFSGGIVYKSFHATRSQTRFSARRSVEIRAEFVHRVDQRGDVLRRGELWNAVPEVEYVAGPGAERLERAADLAPHRLGRRKQHRWIDIPLKRRLGADAPASLPP